MLALAGALTWWGLFYRPGGPPSGVLEPVPTHAPAATPSPVGQQVVAPSPTPIPVTPSPQPTFVAPSPTPSPSEVVTNVLILYTTCEGDGACGLMASGKKVHAGAAACNPLLMPFGTRFRIHGWPQELVCEDIHPYLSGWYVVVWFQTEAEGSAFRRQVGRQATIEIIYRPRAP